MNNGETTPQKHRGLMPPWAPGHLAIRHSSVAIGLESLSRAKWLISGPEIAPNVYPLLTRPNRETGQNVQVRCKPLNRQA
jgi:hypothetical protein